MKRIAAAAAVGMAMLAPASMAHAGVYGDELTKCLVKSTTADDQIQLVVWIYSAMSAHPDVRQYAKVTDADRDAANKRAGDLLVRLLTRDCRKEAVAALKYEGRSAIEPAFRALGEVAMRGLMSDPAVAKSVAGMAASGDTPAMRSMLSEVGGETGAKPK